MLGNVYTSATCRSRAVHALQASQEHLVGSVSSASSVSAAQSASLSLVSFDLVGVATDECLERVMSGESPPFSSFI